MPMKSKEEPNESNKRRMSSTSDKIETGQPSKAAKVDPTENISPKKQQSFMRVDACKIFQQEERDALEHDSASDIATLKQTCDNIQSLVTDINTMKVVGGKEEELKDTRRDAVLLVTGLKKLNRMTQIRRKDAMEKTQQAKSKVDALHLELQNLLYEVIHMKKEIQKCVNFSSKDEEIDLIDVDTFYKQAPEDVTQPEVTKTDAHKQMLARLDWELRQRKDLLEQKNSLVEEKKKIECEITTNSGNLRNLKPGLNEILKATVPVQEFMKMPLEKERKSFEAAQYLSRPLYVLYTQAKAYNDAYDKEMDVIIEGDVIEAKNKLNINSVVLDEVQSDVESDNEANEQPPDEDRRRKSHKGKVSANTKMEDKRKKLLEAHALSVKLVISQKGKYRLELVFKYLTQLNVCTVAVNLELQENPTSPLLSSGIILRDLLTPDDSGEDLPTSSMGTHYLEQAGVSSFTPHVDSLGHPYMWAQWVCGLNLLPNEDQQVSLATSDVCKKHFPSLVKSIRKRLSARLSLQKQLLQLDSLKLVEMDHKFPMKPVSLLTSWKEITTEDFMHDEAGRRLLEQNVIFHDSLFYSAAINRKESLEALVAIHPNYPLEPPLFLLKLKNPSVYSQASLKCLEREVNCYTEEMTTSKHLLLTSMIHKLLVCFDIHMEGLQGSNKEKLFIRKSRGRDRNRPYKYHNDGYFVQR